MRPTCWNSLIKTPRTKPTVAPIDSPTTISNPCVSKCCQYNPRLKPLHNAIATLDGAGNMRDETLNAATANSQADKSAIRSPADINLRLRAGVPLGLIGERLARESAERTRTATSDGDVSCAVMIKSYSIPRPSTVKWQRS